MDELPKKLHQKIFIKDHKDRFVYKDVKRFQPLFERISSKFKK